MRSMAIPFVLACLVASPAAADVTITGTSTGKAMMVDLGGTQVTRIKGNKMRIDTRRGDKETAVILDIDGQRMIALDVGKKEATVMPVAKLQEALNKTAPGEIKAKVTPTAETRTVAGMTCTVHEVSVEVPFNMGEGMQMTMVMSGPACLSKDAPGYADYVRLYTAVSEKGFILGDPRALQGPGASQQRGMAAFQKTMAASGLPLDQTMSVEIRGDGPMAGMMNRMGKMTIAQVVSKIETGDVAADVFDVPAGYKVKQN